MKHRRITPDGVYYEHGEAEWALVLMAMAKGEDASRSLLLAVCARGAGRTDSRWEKGKPRALAAQIGRPATFDLT